MSMKSEKEILDAYQTTMRFDEATRQEAQNLFEQYSSKQHEQLNGDTIHVMLRCAILAASKMQVYPTVSDVQPTFRGCGLTVGQFLRGPPTITIDLFFRSLRHFIDYVNLPLDVQRELLAMINHFAFILTIYTKYEEVLRRLGVTGKLEHAESFRTAGWLIFILARVHILRKKNDIVESACLLIAVVSFMLSHSPHTIVCVQEDATGKAQPSAPLGPERHGEIVKQLCDIFKLSNQEVVVTIEEALRTMLQQLKDLDALRCASAERHNFAGVFEPERIALSIKRLSAQYQQHITPDELDERIFVTSETKITTPLKFTPFARQGGANKAGTPAKPDTEPGACAARQLRASKRMLTYEGGGTGKENVTLTTKLNEIKFSQYVTQSPYNAIKLPAATPITRAMEMNNWLQDHVSKAQVCDGFFPTVGRVLPLLPETFGPALKGVLESTFKKLAVALGSDKSACEEDSGKTGKADVKSQRIRWMYSRIAEELLCVEEKKTTAGTAELLPIVQNMKFHKAVIAAATEVVLFVHNSMALRFEQILELCELSAFDFWKLIRPFLKFDPVMPSPLRMHFQEIEVKILTWLAWQRNSPIHLLLSQIVARERQEENKNAIRIENNYSVERDDLMSLGGKQTPMRDIGPPQPKDEKKEDPQRQWANAVCTSVQLFREDGDTISRSDRAMGLSPAIGTAHELFFKRVLHVVSSKIIVMAEALSISDEVSREKIWEAIKHCLSMETELLIDRHVDQLLLCTIYAICKMRTPGKFTFNNIISHYIDIYSHASENVTSLFFSVKIDEHKHEDIIGFYNHIYILRMRMPICQICNSPPSDVKSLPRPVEPSGPSMNDISRNPGSQNKRKIRALAPESPLNASLPPAGLQYQVGTYSKTVIGANGGRKMASPLPSLTPRTQALYAFGECPSAPLARGGASFTPSVSSDRTDDFKKHLRSQILLPPKPPPTQPTAENGPSNPNPLMRVGGRFGKPPKPGKPPLHLGPLPDTIGSCSKSLFTAKADPMILTSAADHAKAHIPAPCPDKPK